jgi:hypothetical protein
MIEGALILEGRNAVENVGVVVRLQKLIDECVRFLLVDEALQLRLKIHELFAALRLDYQLGNEGTGFTHASAP